MTKEEQNQIIKDAWVRNLQKEGDIPEDVASIYRNWVLTLIQKVSEQLNASAQQQPAEQQQNSQEEKQNG